VEEIYKENRFAQFGSDWKDLKLSEKCILMGHSMGALTVLKAAKNCERANAICALDPPLILMAGA